MFLSFRTSNHLLFVFNRLHRRVKFGHPVQTLAISFGRMGKENGIRQLYTLESDFEGEVVYEPWHDITCAYIMCETDLAPTNSF